MEASPMAAPVQAARINAAVINDPLSGAVGRKRDKVLLRPKREKYEMRAVAEINELALPTSSCAEQARHNYPESEA